MEVNDFLLKYKAEKSVTVLGGPDSREGIGEVVRDILVSKMNEIQRSTRWDTKKRRMSKRITKREKALILTAYEREIGRGKNRDEILSKLTERYHRSERQIERYIQQAKKARKGKQEQPVSQVLVSIDDKSHALVTHYEAIREAIKLWIEKQHMLSDKELADLLRGKLDAWGVAFLPCFGTKTIAVVPFPE